VFKKHVYVLYRKFGIAYEKIVDLCLDLVVEI